MNHCPLTNRKKILMNYVLDYVLEVLAIRHDLSTYDEETQGEAET